MESLNTKGLQSWAMMEQKYKFSEVTNFILSSLTISLEKRKRDNAQYF